MGSRSRSTGGSRSQEARLEEIRRQNAADVKRRRAILIATAAVVAVLVAITVAAFVLAARGDGGDSGNVAAGGEADGAGADPAGVTLTSEDDPDSGGFVVGSEGSVDVVVYEDFMCPNCKAYEESAGDALAELESGEDATVVHRPIAILDRVTGDGIYSSRSAGAAACVGETGDDEAFRRFTSLLYDEQPAEDDAGSGLDDERLAALAGQAGADDEVVSCILERTYVDWAGRATEAATAEGVTATPTVTVDGEILSNDEGGPPDPEQLRAAVQAAGSGAAETGADGTDDDEES